MRFRQIVRFNWPFYAAAGVVVAVAPLALARLPHAWWISIPAYSGLSLVTRLVADAPRRLRSGGSLIFEFGFGQDVEIEDLLAASPDLELVDVRRDLDGIARTAVARRK